MSNVRYEWDIEEVDEHGDVVDHNFASSLARFRPGQIDDQHVLVLVRDQYSGDDGELINRSWAYAERVDGKLVLEDSFWDSCARRGAVPKRFFAELDKWLGGAA